MLGFGGLTHLPLPGGFPSPTGAEAEAAVAVLGEALARGPVLVDGLALGALPGVAGLPAELRARLAALCHHPLGLEPGLSPAESARRLAEESAALAACAAVAVTSDTTGRTLTERLGVPSDRITVALPGTDPAPQAPRRGDPPLILGVGTLSRRKGWDLLLSALAAVADRPWRAVIAGADDRDPETAAALRAQCEARRLAGRVDLPGALPRAEVDRLYLEADLFVLPSRYEGFGMVVTEALARGLPVIAADAGAVAEAAGGAARLVPPEDPRALAEALEDLLDRPAARDRLAAAARARAADLPGWKDTARRLRAMLEALR